MVEEVVKEIGQVRHFFAKIGVAVTDLTQPLAVGDRILIKGPTTDFEQTVDSIQIDRKNVPHGEGGQSIGLKLVKPAKEKDAIYKRL